jgi:acyl carrier protein
MAGNLSSEERLMAQLIVESLNLEGTSPDDIDPDAALFGTGLSLDSIDALELAVAIAARYGVHLKAEDEETQQVFSSLRALTRHVEANKAS